MSDLTCYTIHLKIVFNEKQYTVITDVRFVSEDPELEDQDKQIDYQDKLATLLPKQQIINDWKNIIKYLKVSTALRDTYNALLNLENELKDGSATITYLADKTPGECRDGDPNIDIAIDSPLDDVDKPQPQPPEPENADEKCYKALIVVIYNNDPAREENYIIYSKTNPLPNRPTTPDEAKALIVSCNQLAPFEPNEVTIRTNTENAFWTLVANQENNPCRDDNPPPNPDQLQPNPEAPDPDNVITIEYEPCRFCNKEDSVTETINFNANYTVFPDLATFKKSLSNSITGQFTKELRTLTRSIKENKQDGKIIPHYTIINSDTIQIRPPDHTFHNSIVLELKAKKITTSFTFKNRTLFPMVDMLYSCCPPIELKKVFLEESLKDTIVFEKPITIVLNNVVLNVIYNKQDNGTYFTAFETTIAQQILNKINTLGITQDLDFNTGKYILNEDDKRRIHTSIIQKIIKPGFIKSKAKGFCRYLVNKMNVLRGLPGGNLIPGDKDLFNIINNNHRLLKTGGINTPGSFRIKIEQ